MQILNVGVYMYAHVMHTPYTWLELKWKRNVYAHSVREFPTNIAYKIKSLSATGITRCSAWVHLGNINYIKYQLQGLNTELVYFGISKTIEEKKGVNIEKHVILKKKYT
jgi:hypothetical protein